MDLEPTLEPKAPDGSLARGFTCDAVHTPNAAAVAQADRSAEKDRGTPSAGADAPTETGLDIESSMSSIAASVAGERAEFMRSLYRAVGDGISPAARRRLNRGGDWRRNELAAFERLVDVVVDGAKPQTAAAICAALATRTVARSLVRTKTGFGPADGEALLSAWLDVARAIFAARGSEGLTRLLPTAKLVVIKSTGRESAREIAAAVSRVAARIAADASLHRAFGASH
jgi:hypothetical protein